MNFWQFADTHPIWVTVWIFMLAMAIPSVNWSRKTYVKSKDDTSNGDR